MPKKNNWKKRNTVNNGLASALGLDFYSSATSPFELYSNASPFILSNQWVELVNLYKNNGFIKLAVDLPVADCFRNGGYELESATLDGEELQELNETLHTKDDEIIKQVMRWARLFGGGSIVCNTEQQPDTPFNPEILNEVESFTRDNSHLHDDITDTLVYLINVTIARKQVSILETL